MEETYNCGNDLSPDGPVDRLTEGHTVDVKDLALRVEAAFEQVWYSSDLLSDRSLDDFSVLVSVPKERRLSFRLKDSPNTEVLSLTVGEIKCMSPKIRRMFSPGSVDENICLKVLPEERDRLTQAEICPSSTLNHMAIWAGWYQEGVRHGELSY